MGVKTVSKRLDRCRTELPQHEKTRIRRVRKIARMVRRAAVRCTGYSDLATFCYETATVLAEELRKHDVTATVVRGLFDGDEHAWVELGQEWILDVTRTQFVPKPEVYLEKMNRLDSVYVRRSGLYSDNKWNPDPLLLRRIRRRIAFRRKPNKPHAKI